MTAFPNTNLPIGMYPLNFPSLLSGGCKVVQKGKRKSFSSRVSTKMTRMVSYYDFTLGIVVMSNRLEGYNLSRDRLLLKPDRCARLHVEFIKSLRRLKKLRRASAIFSGLVLITSRQHVNRWTIRSCQFLINTTYLPESRFTDSRSHKSYTDSRSSVTSIIIFIDETRSTICDLSYKSFCKSCLSWTTLIIQNRSIRIKEKMVREILKKKETEFSRFVHVTHYHPIPIPNNGNTNYAGWPFLF